MRKLILDSPVNLLPLAKRALFWYGRYYFLKKFTPLSCGLYVTNRCNLKCDMCSVWREEEKKTLPLEVNKMIIDDLRKLGCYYLSFSGGEPLLVEDIMARVAYAKTNLPYVHLVSNGYFLNKKIAQDLAATKINEISISIDGTEPCHDKIRGLQGSFRKALEAVDNLKTYAPKVTIVVNTIISPENIPDIYQVVELVEKKGLLQKFQPLNRCPIFKGQRLEERVQQFSQDKLNDLDEFISYVQKKKNIVNGGYFLSQIPNFFRGNVNQGIFEDVCKFGMHHCEIKEDASIFPCLFAMEWQGGFSLKEGLKKTMETVPYRDKVNSLKNCRLCKKAMYICYLEPRSSFPLSNFVKYNILSFS